MFLLEKGIRAYRPIFDPKGDRKLVVVFGSELRDHGRISQLMDALRDGGDNPRLIDTPASIASLLTVNQQVFVIEHESGDIAHHVYEKFGLKKEKMLIP